MAKISKSKTAKRLELENKLDRAERGAYSRSQVKQFKKELSNLLYPKKKEVRKPVKRKFNGKVYKYWKGYTNKNDAIRNSEILREKGNLVRRVKGRIEKITNRRYNYLFVRKK